MIPINTLKSVLSDAELILSTRAGDSDAYAELYSRHVDSAKAAAHALTRSKADVDDIVAEAFSRVLSVLQRGGGPDVSFRPYLLTSVRNAFYDRTRKAKREEVTDEVEDSVNFSLLDMTNSEDDRALVATAFASLPERWQLVLWHTEVEGRSPAEVAPLIGLAPNAVAALAYRAREGLRTAYLQSHLQQPMDVTCKECATNLGAYVRDGLSARDRRRVEDHLEGCASCKALLLELQDANTHLRAVLIPLIVGVPAAKYLAALGLSTTVAVNCVVALAMGLTVVLALMRAERVWRRELAKEGAHARPAWMVIVAGLNWLVLATAVLCLLAGYVAFGSFAVKQVVWACNVLGLAYLLAALIDDALMAWLAAGAPEADGASAPPSAKTSAQIAVLLSGALRLALLLVALMLLLAPFGEGPTDLMRRSGEWQQGISIGEFKLQPTALLQAMLVLVVGLGVVRLLRKWLANRYLPTTSLDPGMRASATSLFGYAGVVTAISLAMSAMGIGLERIAWVASALSVGIGFGLQAVVQNFISGLILLAERPVKVGDWVSLAGIEGDIRRINVRATEIQMGDRSTVIVPNSEFITKIVRNVTLADPLGLVQIKLPVPLGSDVETVREQLLQAFDANTDVLDTPGPAVLLDGIDHGQLLFNATGFAKSPRVTGGVRSALLFDMLQRLQAAGITLSAPPTMFINAPMAPPTLEASPSPDGSGTRG